jgi:hypothetical protein
MSVDRFDADRGKYHIIHIDEDRLELYGGGDYYHDDSVEPDADTQAEARKLAEKYGMTITASRGEWRGWSEYTPDPGDVSVFYWSRA